MSEPSQRGARGEGHQSRLLRQRRFAPFFWTQFLGAMNDNVFKIAFTSLVTYHASLFQDVDGKTAAFLISAIFIAPFLLFSATSGQIADKWDKARLIRFVKTLEIVIMAVGALGFLWTNASLLYACTFLMGLHSTLFGPVKYAYLPQHLATRELVGGNGLVEMGTFVAILIGTILGGEIAAAGAPALPWLGGVCLALAALGRLASVWVPQTPAAQPDLRINWNPITETWRNLKIARGDRAVFQSLLGISWLWFLGATFLASFFNFSRDVLGADPGVVTLLLAMFSVGIGAGSLLCERLSGGKVEIGLVPFGSIGMTVFAVDLYFASRGGAGGASLQTVAQFIAVPKHWRILADLFLLAMFGGFYSVPLYALIQSRSAPSHRARIIAANNILNALFMIVSALMAMALTRAGLTIDQLYLVTGILNALVAVYLYTLLPEFLIRFVMWLLLHTVYRIEVEGADRIPDEGPCVLVCNHVSFADAVVIGASIRRPVRFVMDHRIFRMPVLSWFFRTVRAIPIAPAHEDAHTLERAYAQISGALDAGEVVCIFPEGKLTASGDVQLFRQGIQRIVERTPVPVIPMALRGLWGSFFSRHGGAAMTRPFKRGILNRLELVIGEPVTPAQATPEALREKVLRLRGPWPV
ncbi:MFS transporter [Pandoraea sp. CB10b_02]|uniref:MFS transporter n=1 Tax=Pandoraea sp. CB10b_02 TaxID=2014535 RepID=UPI00257D89A7|nr:MFS transporter [Pandoraea sp. CB10b_02]